MKYAFHIIYALYFMVLCKERLNNIFQYTYFLLYYKTLDIKEDIMSILILGNISEYKLTLSKPHYPILNPPPPFLISQEIIANFFLNLRFSVFIFR